MRNEKKSGKNPVLRKKQQNKRNIERIESIYKTEKALIPDFSIESVAANRLVRTL